MTDLVISTVTLHNPEAKNVIIGQSHFIKTVEDIHEALVSTVPGIKFGLAFAEASGPRLIRTSGTHDGMIQLAAKNTEAIGCGHTFILFLDNAFPINVLNQIKMIPEVVHLFCATANPLEIVVAQTKQGRGILGVIDGGSPLGIENSEEKQKRITFLRDIGYKVS